MPSLVNKLRDAFFGRHVWITNTVTSGGLFAIGDAAQQQIEKYQHGDKDTAFDYNRNDILSDKGQVSVFECISRSYQPFSFHWP